MLNSHTIFVSALPTSQHDTWYKKRINHLFARHHRIRNTSEDVVTNSKVSAAAEMVNKLQISTTHHPCNYAHGHLSVYTHQAEVIAESKIRANAGTSCSVNMNDVYNVVCTLDALFLESRLAYRIFCHLKIRSLEQLVQQSLGQSANDLCDVDVECLVFAHTNHSRSSSGFSGSNRPSAGKLIVCKCDLCVLFVISILQNWSGDAMIWVRGACSVLWDFVYVLPISILFPRCSIDLPSAIPTL